MFTSPGGLAFSVLGFPIHWYGIVMSIAIIAGLFSVLKIRKHYYPEISQDLILDLAFYNIIFGIIGARLYYVILDFKYYSKHLTEVLAIWNGGLAIHGTIIACIITTFIFVKIKKLDFYKVSDIFTYGLVIGQVIGRWGNFFNSEAYGMPTNLPWKLFIPIERRPIEFYNVEFYHPTFLYESILNFIIFTILFFVIRRCRFFKDGNIFFSYLVMYGIARFLVESIRIDSILYIFGIPIPQIASILFLLIGVLGLYFLQNKKEKC